MVTAVAAIATLALPPSTQAATATATVGASLLGSLASATVLNLEFGELTAGPIAGTVIMTPNGIRSSTGGVNLSLTGTSNPATFSLTGNPNATYAITLPPSLIISDGGSNNMVVDAFNSLPDAVGQLSAAGQQTLTIGGTLNVPANQPMGNYSGVMNLTIVYN